MIDKPRMEYAESLGLVIMCDRCDELVAEWSDSDRKWIDPTPEEERHCTEDSVTCAMCGEQFKLPSAIEVVQFEMKFPLHVDPDLGPTWEDLETKK